MFGAATEFGKFSTGSRGGGHPGGVRGGGGVCTIVKIVIPCMQPLIIGKREVWRQFRGLC